ncbi:hypothetical protein OG592_27100 [Streptomyces avidinii]|uniref:hypothetical protein n=1 Tax=Streptomyces avidinii TaxID=1895 RepID=UPI00386F5BF5|nr:hypothetical protein OG592_27100 [Streptomyces avidinii]
MPEHLVTAVLRNLIGQAEAQLGKPRTKTPTQQKADQLYALAVRGDRAGMDRLIRSWPENVAREVVALLEKR